MPRSPAYSAPDAAAWAGPSERGSRVDTRSASRAHWPRIRVVRRRVYRGVVSVEVTIRSAASASYFLALGAEPWNEEAGDWYEGPDVTVELSLGSLRAVTVLPAYIADAERLAPLFHEIDRDWRGWPGTKTAGLLGRDWLALSAVHDGKGHVELTIHLSEGWPMAAAWSVSARIPIDVGSAGSIADALDGWQAAIWPSRHRWRKPG